MFIALLAAIFSFSCLIISTIALAIVIKILHSSSKGSELASSPHDAILITGCDSGIGLELAKYYYRATSFTIVCGFLNDISSDGYHQLSDIASKCNDSRLILRMLDVTSETDINETTHSINRMIDEGKLRNLFAVINNAGTMVYGEFDWLTWDQIMNQIEVNFMGPIRLIQSLLPLIIRSGGRIINVSSVNDNTVFPGSSVYSATKSAISTFSCGLGYELRKFNVNVINIRLGDFARLTNIMTKHPSNRDTMWRAMDDKKRNLYGDYFDKFNSHLLENYGMTSPRNFQDSSLFKDFRLALLAKNPPTTITCAPLAYRIFYSTSELIPVRMQYCLLDLLIQFAFKWKQPEPLTQHTESTQTEGSEHP